MDIDKTKIPYQELIKGDIPPWVMRFLKKTGKTINSYSMILEGETILIAASGGKDSLALSLALSLRRKWMPVTYSLKALMINWKEHPIEKDWLKKLDKYYTDLSIDFLVKDEKQEPESFKGVFNCYLCSRNRRRILFEYAKNENIEKIAMGHHLDDIVETTLMNMCFRGKFSSMLPVQDFFEGKIKIIRPLSETPENTTKRLSEVYDLPTIKPVCPYDQTNIRSKLKPIVKELSHIDKLSREHIYSSLNFEKNELLK